MVQGLMPHDLYLQLDQTPEQRRRVGARGGRASARNQRSRLSATTATPPQPAIAESKPRAETTAEAIAVLDTQFFWLRGVEKRRGPSQAPSWTVLLAE